MNSVQRASLKQILSPPPLQRLKQGSETAKRILAEGTLEDWLKFRDWHHVLPGPVPIDPIEFLSALLTYPLTIAKTLAHRELKSKTTSSTCTTTTINIIGARAECTLPVDFYSEITYATPPSTDKIEINFFGPEVLYYGQGGNSTNRDIRRQTLDNHELILSTFDPKVKFEDLEHCESSNNFVFNPGFGHPHLKSSWEPFLSSVDLCSLTMTSYSEKDLTRDIEQLQSSHNFVPKAVFRNHFHSRKSHKTLDQDQDEALTNYYIAM